MRSIQIQANDVSLLAGFQATHLVFQSQYLRAAPDG